MTDKAAAFRPLPAGPSATVSWIHLGDLHMTRAGEQNEVDLGRIIDDINQLYTDGSVQFVFLPGDIADDGSRTAYEAVRSHLDRLRVPWCGIVGDHDVHERSFENFKHYIASDLYSAFTVGNYRFLRLNAFSEPRPDAFIVDEEQLQWLEGELKQCRQDGTRAVLLLHCYPSDLKQGGSPLSRLVREYPVLLIDMGHTHYNEISNDGALLYTATRSTGQIEEGPVGYSVTTLDGDVVSWHFVEPGAPGLVDITSPADYRLQTTRSGKSDSSAEMKVRAKVWSRTPVSRVEASLGTATVRLSKAGDIWEGKISSADLREGDYKLTLTATAEHGSPLTGSIDLRVGDQGKPDFSPVDQENAIGAWPERGILGTQLGPNKNGRKW